MPLNEVAPNQFELTVGAFDTEDGISVSIAGEAFPRLRLSPAGVATGDGTTTPVVPVEVPSAVGEADGTYLLLATVTDDVAVLTYVDAADYVNP